MSSIAKEWLPFTEAREWVRSQKLINREQWRSLSLPDNIPRCPERVYKDFQGYGDWLNTGFVATRKRQYRTFKEAKEWAKKSGIVSRTQWKIANIPDDIPRKPERTYSKEWQGWGDFLDTGAIAPVNKCRQYLPFCEAREWARSLGFKHQREWNSFVVKLPSYIPRSPESVYCKEWESWGDWLQEGYSSRQFVSFEEAREWAKRSHIRTSTQWITHVLPTNIPKYPNEHYQEKWISWGHFLGTGRRSPKKRERSQRSRRLIARPSWVQYQDIKPFYEHARLMTKITGVKHCVDHIDPITHDFVCGLHVPCNLRVVTHTKNCSKSNIFRSYSFNGLHYEYLSE